MRISSFNDIKSLFLENISIRQTLVKNTLWLGLSAIISRTLTFFLFVAMARILGVTEYGIFSFALAFVYLFGALSDVGISQIAAREVSRKECGEECYSALFLLKICLISVAMAFTVFGSFFISTDVAVRKVIWILAGYVFIGSFTQLVYAIFQARQKMEYEAWFSIMQAVLFTVFGFYALFYFPSVENISYSYLVGTLFFLVILLTFFHKNVSHIRFAVNISIWWKFIMMSWPVALSGLFMAIYNWIDTVMIGAFGQINEVGWYNAAWKIAQIAYVPAILLSQSTYPALSIAFKESNERLQRIWNVLMEVSIFLLVPLVVGGIFLASKIIDFVYDVHFAPAIGAFQILIVMSGLVFISTPFQTVLIAANQQRKTLWVVLTGVVINVVLNLILIPRYSFYGAAFTTVLTYLVMFFLLVWITFRYASIQPMGRRLGRPAVIACISSMVMFVVISNPLLDRFHVTAIIAVGMIIYCCVVFLSCLLINKMKESFANYL